MDEKKESCCTIDYAHHKEIFEKRRQAFLKDPDKDNNAERTGARHNR